MRSGRACLCCSCYRTRFKMWQLMFVTLQSQAINSVDTLLGDCSAEIWAALLRDSNGQQTIISLPNVSGSRTGFVVTHAAWWLVTTYAHSRTLEVVALVHSHPNGTTLSPADESNLASSEIPWIVVTRSPTGVCYSVYGNPSQGRHRLELREMSQEFHF